MDATARLAHRITWGSSKQSYLTAILLADRDLADDCLRAYAYFRWADDIIDLKSQSEEECNAFIARQSELIERLYRGETPDGLSPEEEILSDLIAHDHAPDSGLRSFIYNFMAVIAFDATRRGRTVTRWELSAYTSRLATAVMDGLLYFIDNGHPYPKTPERTLAVLGAHYTHMLRDLRQDLPAGFINIPAEDLAAYGIDPADPGGEPLRRWTCAQVRQARDYFRAGRRYIESLDNLRCKLAGMWYCARFERLLDAIEREGYCLRCEYRERHSLSAWLATAWLGVTVVTGHLAGRIWQGIPHWVGQTR
jgi:phytoene synthase